MPTTRDNVFNRVDVDYAVKGVSGITWSLREGFREPAPHIYQLQVNRNGGSPGCEWTDVGTTFTDNMAVGCGSQQIQHTAEDEDQRLWGKQMQIVYRVKLVTPFGNTYYSPVAQVLGRLTFRQWLQYRAIRRRLLLSAPTLADLQGVLLKRTIYGLPCTACLDVMTGGITNSGCATCNGTGKLDGYWVAGQNTMIDMNPTTRYTQQDNSKKRGTVNDVVAVGQFLGIPLIGSRDVWVDTTSDRRYYIHKVSNVAELNQVPIICEAELRLAPFSDAIYNESVTEEEES